MAFEEILAFLSKPWPWYVAGPLVGLVVPALLRVGGRPFGISSSLRHICAALVPSRLEFFRYDWRGTGLWNLAFVAGIVIGGGIAATLLAGPETVAISEATRADLAALGVRDFSGLVPGEVFSWSGLLTIKGMLLIVAGGFLVGFGTRYAGGCTSGHAITGLANLQWPSLIAVIGFFAGGLVSTHLLLPLIF